VSVSAVGALLPGNGTTFSRRERELPDASSCQKIVQFSRICDDFFVDIVTNLSYIRVRFKVLNGCYFEVLLTFFES
jgi:hypothetical protein